jgi:hypothetical protein
MVDARQWMHLDGLPLADSHRKVLGDVDIFIGTYIWSDRPMNGHRHGTPGAPHA